MVPMIRAASLRSAVDLISANIKGLTHGGLPPPSPWPLTARLATGWCPVSSFVKLRAVQHLTLLTQCWIVKC
eukprot:3098476-Amphidinium_carterae.1